MKYILLLLSITSVTFSSIAMILTGEPLSLSPRHQEVALPSPYLAQEGILSRDTDGANERLFKRLALLTLKNSAASQKDTIRTAHYHQQLTYSLAQTSLPELVTDAYIVEKYEHQELLEHILQEIINKLTNNDTASTISSNNDIVDAITLLDTLIRGSAYMIQNTIASSDSYRHFTTLISNIDNPHITKLLRRFYHGYLQLTEPWKIHHTYQDITQAQYIPQTKYIYIKEASTVVLQAIDIESGNHVKVPDTIIPPSTKNHIIRISPDNTKRIRVFTESVALYNNQTNQRLRTFDQQKLMDCSIVTFSPNGAYILITTGNKAYIYNASTYKALCTVTHYTNNLYHNADVTIHTAIFSPDSKYMATVCFGEVCVWDLSLGIEIQHIETNAVPTEITFSYDSTQLMTLDFMSGDIHIWHMSTGKCIHTLKNLGISDANRCIYAAFSPNTPSFITLSQGGLLRLWHQPSLKAAKKIGNEPYT